MKPKRMNLWKGLLVVLMVLGNSPVHAEEIEETDEVEINVEYVEGEMPIFEEGVEEVSEESVEKSEEPSEAISAEEEFYATHYDFSAIEAYGDEESAYSYDQVLGTNYPEMEVQVANNDEVNLRLLKRAVSMSEAKGVPTYTDGDFFYYYGVYEGNTGWFMLEVDGTYEAVEELDLLMAMDTANGCFVRGTYNGDSNAIMGYDQNCGGNITIPAGTATIGKFAFATSGNAVGRDLPAILETVDLPNSLKTIGTCAFTGQSKLSEVTGNGQSHQVPNSVTWMGDYIFYGTALGYMNFNTPANYSACQVGGYCDPLLSSTRKGYVKKQSNGTFVYDFRDSRNTPGINIGRIVWGSGSDLGGGSYDANSGTITFSSQPTSFKYHYMVANGYDPTDINTVNIELFTLTYHLRSGDKGTLQGNSGPIYMDGTTKINNDIAHVSVPKGYVFLGYYVNGSELTEAELKNITVTSNMDVELRTAKETYPITYELNGGTNDKSNPDSYTVEDSVTFKNPTRNGYDFLGWYSDPNGKSEIKSIPSGSSGEVKVYALWKPVIYPVKYELNGGTNDKSNPTSYTVESETLTIKDATKDHYDFKGWKEGNQIPKGSTGEKLFTALFEAKSYPITYVLNGGTNDKSNPVSYTIESDDITIKDPSRNGYKFTGWKEGNKIPKGSSGDKTFTAQWEAVPYDITYVLEGGMNDKDNPSSYTIESKDIDIKDPTKEGYKFIGWKEGNKIPSGSTGDKTFTAQWEAVPYDITYVLDGGTNDKSNPSTYTVESEEIKLKDPTKTGYDFVGWKEGDVIPKGSTGDKTFTAQFKPISYGITYDMDGGTNSGDNPLNYTIESPTITLKTPTKKGYSFISWVEGNQIPSGSTGIKHFTASWKIENYPVTFLGFNKAEVSKQSVTYNEKASRVEAPGVTDYYFDGWYYDEAFTKKYSFDDPIVGATILYGSYKPIFKVKETSVEVQKYTEDECGNVKDEWGNIIYTGTKCPVKKTSYTLPNTGETNPLVSGGFATLLVTCLTPVLAVMKKLK